MVAPIVVAAGKIAVQALATKQGRTALGVALAALVVPPATAVAVLVVAVSGSQQQTATVVAQAQTVAQACQDAQAAVATPTPITTSPALLGTEPALQAPSPAASWAYDEPPQQVLVDCYGSSATDDREYLQPGAWGGYSNGQIPVSAMCLVSFAPVSVLNGSPMYLRCDAEQALEALNVAYEADHGGASLQLTTAYRDLPTQAGLVASGATDAAAGTSNHGWGLAADINNLGNLGDFSSPNYAWMKAHAATYGFRHPAYMEPGGSGPLEPWHWEYWGAPDTVQRPGESTAF